MMGKMTLYEIDGQIADLLSNMVDEETGEISPDAEQELGRLEVARDEKIENIALYIKSEAAFLDDLKAEKAALAARMKRTEAHIESLKRLLYNALDGQKPKSAKFEVRYTHGVSCNVQDPDGLISWAMQNGLFEDLVKVGYDVNITAVKKRLKDGQEIPGAALVETNSISVR